MTRVAIFSPHRIHNGETRAMPKLAGALAQKGYDVDLLRAWKEWDSASLPEGVRVVGLGTRRFAPVLPDIGRLSKMAAYRVEMATIGVAMLPGLVGYLRKERPDVLIARMLTAPAIIGTTIARSSVKLVVSSAGLPSRSRYRRVSWPLLYPRADAFVAPTARLMNVILNIVDVRAKPSRVIPNPVIDETVIRASKEPVRHPWFGNPAVPVILGVGRLTRQKDFFTLVRAFAQARASRPCRLVIVGEGENRPALQDLIASLGVGNDVELVGFQKNPYKYMRAADVFVMSSRWEGPGHTLIEAQALGTPAVSTDCPEGPCDTLLNGEAGLLVPVGGPTAMAEAILILLADRRQAKRMAEVGLTSSHRYQPESVAAEWQELIDTLTHGDSERR